MDVSATTVAFLGKDKNAKKKKEKKTIKKIFAEEGNKSGRNVHNHIFSQCQLSNSFFTKFLVKNEFHLQFCYNCRDYITSHHDVFCRIYLFQSEVYDC